MARRTALLAASALVASLLVPAAAQAGPAAPATDAATDTAADAAITDGLLAWYRLDETSGATVQDSSGNDNDASVVGAQSWNGGLGFDFRGGSANPASSSAGNAVKLPNDLLAGVESITVSADVWVDPSLSGNHFIYTFGNTAVGNPASGSGYLFATAGYGTSGQVNYRSVISDQWWNNEQATAKSGALAKGQWKHLTYTQTGGTGTLYEDGVQVGRNSALTLTPAQIGNPDGATTRNYIGLSAYDADAAFKGVVRDFRVYDRALSGEEVATVAEEAHTTVVEAATAQLDLGDTSAVVADLSLPSTVGTTRTSVSWSSSNTDVLSNTGAISRPAADTTVTLTATITAGTESRTKTFEVVVLESANPGLDDVEAAAASLTVVNAEDARSNLHLPTVWGDGVAVSWSSADPQAVTATGEVTRPAAGSPARTVDLTATLTKGEASATATIAVVIPALPQEEEYEAYMFSYFTADTIPGEKIYFGASNGNDARSWISLNGGQPVFTSTLGTTGLRDPFLIRSPEGDRFYMIATDLSIGSGGGWDAAQRQGSQYLEIWESTDLVTWSEQRHVKVAPDNAGNTWAPEAYWDDSIGAYVVFWASKLYPETDPGHTTGQHQRMMYATTRDFVTFSEAQVWQDTGISRIDSTVIKEGDTYYRFTKDEGRGISGANSCLDIFEERSTDLRAVTETTTTTAPAEEWSLTDTCIGQQAGTGAVEGPTVFKANPGDVNGEGYYLFVDEFSGRKYIPLFSEELGEDADWTIPASFALPSPAPRHGTVLPITAAEHEALLAAYLPEATETVPATARTSVGVPAPLPERVTVRFDDGSAQNMAVTWDTTTNPSYYDTVGSYEFTGTVSGLAVTATVTVTVTATPEENIAPASTATAAPYTEGSYSINRTTNGNRGDKGWSNWQSGTRPTPSTLTYTFAEQRDITGVGVWFYRDGNEPSWPETMYAEYRDADGSWHRAPGFDVDLALASDAGAPVVLRFWDPVEATALRLVLTTTTNRYFTVSEVEIYAATEVVIPPVESPFVDVAVDNPFFEEITWLASEGISTGWLVSDGAEFRPYNNVTRDAMAAFLYRLAGSPEFTAPRVSPFRDVSTSNGFYREIAWLADAGISTGWPVAGGTAEFRPYAHITRDAMAAFLYRYSGEPDFTAPAVSPFVDVTPATPFYREITWLADTGVSTGWPTEAGQEYRPVAKITRDAMAAFLHRLTVAE